MKKIFIYFLYLFLSNTIYAQQTVNISGPTNIEVGVPYDFTFNFIPVYPSNNGVQADSYIITEWIVLTGTNCDAASVSGYINSPSNQSCYYNDSTYGGSNPKTVAIQWGDNNFLTYDQITVKVSGIYRKNSTGENIAYFNYVTNTHSVNIARIIAPNITGLSPIPDCDQTNQIYSISNNTNGNTFLWSVTNGASIIGSANNTSVTVKPPLTGNFEVSCNVKRSTANSNYSKTGNKNITRQPFISNAQILGNTVTCSSNTFTISGLLSGESVTSWSSSNTSIGNITSSSGTSATVAKVSNGTILLTATITNTCSQTTTVSRQIVIGSGEIPAGNYVEGPSCVWFNQYATYTLTGNPVPGATSYNWSVVAPINDDGGPTCVWSISAGQGSQTCTYKVGCVEALAVVRVAAVNGCGQSNYKYIYVNVKPTKSGCTSSRIANNIQKDGSYATVSVDDDSNEETIIEDNVIDFAELYDLSGTLIKKYHTNNYNINDVKKGIYILKVAANNQIITTKIMVK